MPAPQITSAEDPTLTDSPDAFPTDFDSSSFDASLASLTAGLSIYSDLPTLPSSIESVLLTAIPTDTTDDPCATTEPAWLKNLPNDVQAALTSYESALASWYSEHSSDLGSDTTYTGALPTATDDFSDFCSSQSASGSASGSGSAGTAGGVTSGPTATSAGGKSTAAGASGSKSTTAGGSSSTAKGTAASGTNSPGAGAKPTGAVAAGLAGVVGVFGVMMAL